MAEELHISAVIPAHNEEKSIGNVIKSLKQIDEINEIVVVDDGSMDNTAGVAEKEGVHVIRHLKNKGYGGALKTGVNAARNDIIVTLDADGQHDPEELKKFIPYMLKGYDMVVGNRGRKYFSSLWRSPAKLTFKILANYLAGQNIPDVNSGFRIFKKEAVRRFFHILPNGFSFSTTLTLAMVCEGYNVAYVPIEIKREESRSKVTAKDGFNIIIQILRIISLFSPLKIFLPPSLILLCFGGIFSLITLIIEGTVWKSGLLAILSGLMIFFFGLLADQVALMRRELGRNE